MSTAALCQAVWSGGLAEVQHILKHNPNIDMDALDDSSLTPLLLAVGKIRKPIIPVLLAHGASVNGPVGAWRTPLQKACGTCQADIVSLLLEHGADVNATTAKYRTTPLSRACRRYRNSSIVELLLAHGAAVNGADTDESTPLQEAINFSEFDTVSLLLEYGAVVDATTAEEKKTPLTLACKSKNKLGTVELLLNAGAAVNGADDNEITPLQQACSSEYGGPRYCVSITSTWSGCRCNNS